MIFSKTYSILTEGALVEPQVRQAHKYADFTQPPRLFSQQIPSNQNDVIQLCEEKNCSFYACADSLVAIMESLVTQTREWLIPVHITCSKKFGEFDILIKVSPL